MAGDLVRDGMVLELVAVSGGVVADVFYSDTTGEMTLSGYQRYLPQAAVEWLIAHAKVRLPPVTRREA